MIEIYCLDVQLTICVSGKQGANEKKGLGEEEAEEKGEQNELHEQQQRGQLSDLQVESGNGFSFLLILLGEANQYTSFE